MKQHLVILLSILFLLSAESCKTTKDEKQISFFKRTFSRHKLYAMPTSFDDSLKAITHRLERLDKYIIMFGKSGNCFGSSLSGFAKFSWFNKDKTVNYRIITKSGREKKCKDYSFTSQDSSLFIMFNKYRIDTIQKMPTGGYYIDPSSYVTVIIKSNNQLYEKTFEAFPFYGSKDTTNALYNFVIYFNNLKKNGISKKVIGVGDL